MNVSAPLASPNLPSPAPSPARWELILLAVLAGLGGLRVFLAAAALPPFNNVDEEAHYDLVCRYAAGHLPGRGEEVIDAARRRELIIYGSPEYLYTREQFPQGYPPPLWTLPLHRQEPIVRQLLATGREKRNHEIHSPPVYYAVAAAWYRLGALLAMPTGQLIYWVRFLNVVIIVGDVVLAFLLAWRVAPQAAWLRLGSAALVAGVSQDMLYAINSDALSSLLFPATMLLLLEWERREGAAPGWAALAGFAAAMTVLVKYSNIAILLLLALACGRKCRSTGRGALRQNCGGGALALLSAGLPLAGWAIRNKLALGDWSGAGEKISYLGWTSKPLSDWGDHPLFSLQGLAYFWHELIARLWRGEIVWHLEPLTPPPADGLFVWMTTILLVAAGIRWGLSWRTGARKLESDGDLLLAVVASVLFLAWCSVAFDFGACLYPSRQVPYMVSGRLMFGVFVPLVILCLRGSEFLFCRWLPKAGPAIVIAALLATSIICWGAVMKTTAGSQYNWYHMSAFHDRRAGGVSLRMFNESGDARLPRSPALIPNQVNHVTRLPGASIGAILADFNQAVAWRSAPSACPAPDPCAPPGGRITPAGGI